jgi:Rod binding domain-containing protein
MEGTGRINYSLPGMNYQEMFKKDKKELAVEFEAILLKEVLKEAFKPMLESKSFDYRLYYDSFLENLSRKLAQAGGIGVAKFLLENMRDEKGR